MNTTHKSNTITSSTDVDIPSSKPSIMKLQKLNLEESVDKTPDYLCPICFDAVDDPAILPCSHQFCRECLKKIKEYNKLNTQQQRCPICRVAIPQTHKPLKEIIPGLAEYIAIAIFSIFGCVYCFLAQNATQKQLAG